MEFDFNIVKNPEIFEQNRLPVHSDHDCYLSEYERNAGESSLYRKLDGIWKFSYAKNMALAVNGFEKEEYDCRPWDDIRVPAHIQMEGYDAPQYANVQYPWDGKQNAVPGEIPMEFNPVASYVRYFSIPENMKGHKICISFQGVESGFAVWLNGSYVGYSENSFDPADFDLTPYIREDEENKLAVRVFKWTSSSWCEDQDFYRFSGIFRSVYLYMIPEIHVKDLSVVPVLSDDFSEADVELSMKIEGKGRAKISLLDGTDTVYSGEISCEKDTVSTFHVKNPKLWSAELPYLYTLYLLSLLYKQY